MTSPRDRKRPSRPDRDTARDAGEDSASDRPGTVVAGAVMAAVGGTFLTVMGALTGLVGANPELLVQAGYDPAEMAGLNTAGLIAAAVGVLVVVLAVVALRRGWWGAVGLAVLTGIYVGFGVWSLLSGQVLVLIGLVYVVVATALLLTSRAQAWFRAGRS